jgi:hypothetical protein
MNFMSAIPKEFRGGQSILTYWQEEIVLTYWEVQERGWDSQRPENSQL